MKLKYPSRSNFLPVHFFASHCSKSHMYTPTLVLNLKLYWLLHFLSIYLFVATNVRSRLVIILTGRLFGRVAFPPIIVPILPFPSHFSLAVSSILKLSPFTGDAPVSNKQHKQRNQLSPISRILCMNCSTSSAEAFIQSSFSKSVFSRRSMLSTFFGAMRF